MRTSSQFSPELLDQLIGDAKTPEDVFGADGLLKNLQKALLERILDAEMNVTLGYGRGDDKPEHQPNCRNGYSQKTIKTGDAELTIAIPRDRESQHEPLLVPKHSRRLPGFDEKVLSLYARGMSFSEI